MTRIKPQGNLRQKQPRQRDKAYLGYIAALGGPHGFGCVICRTQPCEVAHVRLAERVRDDVVEALDLGPDTRWRFGKLPTGMAEKPSDIWTAPLCPRCHRTGPHAQHTMPEILFWQGQGIDVLQLCHELQQAYPSIEAGVAVLERAKES